MEWMDNFILPSIQLVFYLALLVCFGFGVYYVSYFLIEKITFFVKYKIFKKYDEELIERCFEVLINGKSETDMKRKLLFRGYSKWDIKEIVYVFRKVQKEYLQQMKGGFKK